MHSITVLIPVYNAELTISKTINSLKHSTFTGWNCVIVNDGSTDRSLEIVEKLIDERFVVISYEENKGRGFARNLGLERIKNMNSKYLCFLDSDDIYPIDKLQWQFDFMEKNNNIDLMSCALGLLKDNQLVSILDLYKKNIFITHEYKRKYISVPFASSIIRISCINNISFDENMRYSEDQDFMRKLLQHKEYCYISSVGYYYNKEFSSSTEKYINSIKADLYSAKKTLELSDYFRFKIKSIFKIIFYKLKINKLYSKNHEKVPNRTELEKFDVIKDILQ